jgi:hypothetical protein
MSKDYILNFIAQTDFESHVTDTQRYITIKKLIYKDTKYTFKKGLRLQIRYEIRVINSLVPSPSSTSTSTSTLDMNLFCKETFEIHSKLLGTFEYGTTVKEAWEAFSEMFHVIYETLFESEYSNKLSESSLKLKKYLSENCKKTKIRRKR